MDYTYYDYSTTVGSTETLGIIAGLGVATFIISMIISVIMIISMWHNLNTTLFLSLNDSSKLRIRKKHTVPTMSLK